MACCCSLKRRLVLLFKLLAHIPSLSSRTAQQPARNCAIPALPPACCKPCPHLPCFPSFLPFFFSLSISLYLSLSPIHHYDPLLHPSILSRLSQTRCSVWFYIHYCSSSTLLTINCQLSISCQLFSSNTFFRRCTLTLRYSTHQYSHSNTHHTVTLFVLSICPPSPLTAFSVQKTANKGSSPFHSYPCICTYCSPLSPLLLYNISFRLFL